MCTANTNTWQTGCSWAVLPHSRHSYKSMSCQQLTFAEISKTPIEIWAQSTTFISQGTSYVGTWNMDAQHVRIAQCTQWKVLFFVALMVIAPFAYGYNGHSITVTRISYFHLSVGHWKEFKCNWDQWENYKMGTQYTKQLRKLRRMWNLKFENCDLRIDWNAYFAKMNANHWINGFLAFGSTRMNSN